MIQQFLSACLNWWQTGLFYIGMAVLGVCFCIVIFILISLMDQD